MVINLSIVAQAKVSLSFWDITGAVAAACPLEVPVMDISVQHLKSTPDLLFALIFHKNAREQNKTCQSIV